MRAGSAIAMILPFVMACGREQDTLPSITVSAADVRQFVAVTQHANADAECSELRPYFDSASFGLRAYAMKFRVGLKDLCAAMKNRPDRYASIAPMLPALDSVTDQVNGIFERFHSLDPSARLPDTYFLVGDGVSAGTSSHGRHPMILVGVELVKSPRGLTWTLAHELGHTQQDYPWWGSLTGGPTFLRATVLRQAITEGSAELIAEVLTGTRVRNAYGEAHESEIWRDFRREMHTRDYRNWFYNGRDRARLGDRPPDLGYWVGYRIVQSFWVQRTDKAGALQDILTIRNFDEFLARSGYDGGETVSAQPGGSSVR